MQVTASWRSLSCFLWKVAVTQHRLLRYISTGLTTELISWWEQLMPERRPTAAGLTTYASLCFIFHKNQQAMQVCPLCRQCASPALHTPEAGSIYCRLTAKHTEWVATSLSSGDDCSAAKLWAGLAEHTQCTAISNTPPSPQNISSLRQSPPFLIGLKFHPIDSMLLP